MSIYLSSITSRIQLNNNSQAALSTSGWTYLHWIYTYTVSTYRFFWTKGQSHRFGVGGTTPVIYGYQNTDGAQDYFSAADVGLTSYNWWYIGVTFDNSQAQAEKFTLWYGNLSTIAQGTKTYTYQEGDGNPVMDSTSNMQFGGNWLNTDCQVGMYAFAVIYNRVLTLPEVQQQQYILKPLWPSYCAFNFGFNQVNEQKDLSGNSRHSSTISGGSSVNHIPVIVNTFVPSLPYLITGGTTHNLTAQDAVSGAPVVDTPTIGQTHVLSSQNAESQSPVVGTPTLGSPTPQEYTVTFPFATTAEGFTGYPGTADQTLSYDSGIGNPAGALKSRNFGRNKVGTSYWEWTGTWENLGITAGDTVLEIRLNSAYTRCTEWNVADSATIGPYYIYDSTGATIIATIWSGRSPTGVEGSWIQTSAQTDQTVGASYQASNTSIRIRLYNTMDNGNNANAAISLYDDQVQLVITYLPASVSDDLTAQDAISGAPTVDTPTIGQTHVLSSQDAVGISPVVDLATIGQTHILVSTDAESGSPVVDTPTIAVSHALTSQDAESQSPVVDTPTIGQTHILVSIDAESGSPVVDTSTIGQTHILSSQDSIAGSPVVDNTSIGQTHILVSTDAESGNPTVDLSTLGQTHILASTDAESGNPTVDFSTIGQTHILVSTDAESGNPVVDTPTIYSGVTHNLISQDAISGNPVVEFPTLGQIHALVSLNAESGNPVVDSSSLGQTHILVSQDSVAGNPVVDTPSMTATHELYSQDAISGQPTVDNPVIAQTHLLTGTDSYSQSPLVDLATLGQVHILTGIDSYSGVPEVDTPTLTESAHVLIGQDVYSGQPEVESPTLGQTHILLAQDADSQAPDVSQPTIGQILPDELVAQDAYSQPPVVDTPTLGQVFILTAMDAVSGIPEVETSTLSQIHILLGSDTYSGLPEVDFPTLGQTHILIGQDVYSEPGVVGTPLLIMEMPYVPPERVLTVYPENRTIEIEGEERIITIYEENRSVI